MSQLPSNSVDLLKHVDDLRLRFTMMIADAANRLREGFTEHVCLGPNKLGLGPNWTSLIDHDWVGCMAERCRLPSSSATSQHL